MRAADRDELETVGLQARDDPSVALHVQICAQRGGDRRVGLSPAAERRAGCLRGRRGFADFDRRQNRRATASRGRRASQGSRPPIASDGLAQPPFGLRARALRPTRPARDAVRRWCRFGVRVRTPAIWPASWTRQRRSGGGRDRNGGKRRALRAVPPALPPDCLPRRCRPPDLAVDKSGRGRPCRGRPRCRGTRGARAHWRPTVQAAPRPALALGRRTGATQCVAAAGSEQASADLDQQVAVGVLLRPVAGGRGRWWCPSARRRSPGRRGWRRRGGARGRRRGCRASGRRSGPAGGRSRRRRGWRRGGSGRGGWRGRGRAEAGDGGGEVDEGGADLGEVDAEAGVVGGFEAGLQGFAGGAGVGEGDAEQVSLADELHVGGVGDGDGAGGDGLGGDQAAAFGLLGGEGGVDAMSRSGRGRARVRTKSWRRSAVTQPSALVRPGRAGTRTRGCRARGRARWRAKAGAAEARA